MGRVGGRACPSRARPPAAVDKWHQILRAGWETFKVQGRTSVDLKDKWTILERRGLRDLKADAALRERGGLHLTPP